MARGLAPILRTAQLRALEARHAHAPLMERAGEAAADVATALATRRGPVVVLAGPGNNGGDAFVVARRLRERFFDVVTVFRGDAARLPRDAAAAHRAYVASGGTTLDAPPGGAVALAVDGLFGLGLTRSPGPPHAELIDWINAVEAPRLALDIPSGIDADTGRVVGVAVRATATATFIAWKPGLLTGEGVDHAGEISVHALGVEVSDVDAGLRLDWPALRHALPQVLRRARQGVHKGSFGTLGILGGARGMVGAALLAGRGAVAGGAGKVLVGLLADDAPVVDVTMPELMLRSASDAIDAADALVVGPGLGTAEAAVALLERATGQPAPLVLDADALNLAARDAALRSRIARRTAPTVITPHPAEAARLLASDVAQVQRDRIAAARALCDSLHAHVVVKGAGSVLAHPGGGFDINASGNPALATAGTGDVLAGLLGALLAQRIDARDALRIGVCAHGGAADALVARGIGPLGVRASEVADAVRDLLNRR
jgi:hydroxyethylthiazole kinase-like uncharacterized protein yjeF